MTIPRQKVDKCLAKEYKLMGHFEPLVPYYRRMALEPLVQDGDIKRMALD